MDHLGNAGPSHDLVADPSHVTRYEALLADRVVLAKAFHRRRDVRIAFAENRGIDRSSNNAGPNSDESASVRMYL